MTDREMIELAAKAIGWRVVCEQGTSIVKGGVAVVVADGKTFGWSPRTDDGDECTHAREDRYTASYEDYSEHIGDACSATRLAILRAAAAIGKAMP